MSALSLESLNYHLYTGTYWKWECRTTLRETYDIKRVADDSMLGKLRVPLNTAL